MSETLPSDGSATPPVTRQQEIKLVSHSQLFYWWPVWFLAFIMAGWTYLEDHRLAIVPPGTVVTKEGAGKFVIDLGTREATQSLLDAENNSKPGVSGVATFRARVSQHAALGAIFLIGLVVTIFITNVPLRGLWSFVGIMVVLVLGLLISLFRAWDTVFDKLAGLHIYINMAGYLLVGISVFVLWALATFIFDQRTYVIFAPGQIKVCEHIGASVNTFSSSKVQLEKQRDDLFRHYILGFGSGDLVLHVEGKDILMPNILGIGWRLKSVEDMLRTTAVTA
jgi:hypothetical protein